MTECEVCGHAASATAPLPCTTARGDGMVLQLPPGDCPHQDWHAAYVEAWEDEHAEVVTVTPAPQETGVTPPVPLPGPILPPPGGADHQPLVGSETRLALAIEVAELLAEQYAYRAGIDTERAPQDVALRLAEIYARQRALREGS